MKQFVNIKARLRDLVVNEDGAVTVDWVVLTASIVMLGMASMFIAAGNLPGFANKISSSLSNLPVGDG